MDRYKVKVDCDASITVEIDPEIMGTKELQEINNFWTGANERLLDSGSIIDAVLSMLVCEALKIQSSHNCNLFGVVSAFDWSKGKGVEGWPKMDGSDGIKIIDIDPFYFWDHSISIESVELEGSETK